MLTFYFSCGFCLPNAVAHPCDAVPVAPKIEFLTSYGQLRYDFDKSTQEISRIAAEIGMSERPIFATGLATLSVESEYVIGTSALPLQKNEGYCVVPEIIRVFVGFSRPTIYISNELSPQTCQYNLVMLHEKTHQRINKAALDYFVPYFRVAAEKIGKNLSPLPVKHPYEVDAATDRLTQIFSQKFDKVVEVFKKELAVEQGKLDNQMNYLMEDNICKNFNATHLHR